VQICKWLRHAVLCCALLCAAAACQGVDVVAAHGDKDQQERLDAVRDFKQGICLFE
jgi:superfamily II DNA/RNA helicase